MNPTKSLNDIPGIAHLVQASMTDTAVRRTVLQLVSMPRLERQFAVVRVVAGMRAQGAPGELVQAIACLSDEVIAAEVAVLILEVHGHRM